MVVRIRVRVPWIKGALPAAEQPLFAASRIPAHKPGSGLALSLLIHACALLVLSFAARAVILLRDDDYHPVYIYQPLPAFAAPVLHSVPGSDAFAPPSPRLTYSASAAPAASEAAPVELPPPPPVIAPSPPPISLTVPLPLEAQTDLQPDGCIRVVHPRDAVPDLEVVQSSDEELLPGAATVLTGRPVRTVFLNVGTPKDWTVQYCVPNDTPTIEVVNSMLVKLPLIVPVRAPYPVVTVLTPRQLPRDGSTVIFGILDASGHLTNLRALPGATAEPGLLDEIAGWLFRPATRGGAATPVEMVLAVPPGSNP